MTGSGSPLRLTRRGQIVRDVLGFLALLVMVGVFLGLLMATMFAWFAGSV